MRLTAITCLAIFLLSFVDIHAQSARSDVRIVTDEAEAVLAILEKRNVGSQIDETDWKRIFESEGFRRLKKREESLKRSFTEEDFKTFVLSDALAAKTASLRETLKQWSRADFDAAAGRALAYLPAHAKIRAKIYPVIKPRDNSFVFEVKTDPAIFLYLDPSVTKEQFENTIAHELHHIGYGSDCPDAETAKEIETLAANRRQLIRWIGAFGEGLAMLAAAGGADTHPHKFSKPEERARWDRDAANFNQDLQNVEQFFREILVGNLSEDKINEKGFSFFGVQGPWYTVGWRMAVTIEKTFGREKLIESFCDERKLLPTFNEAIKKQNGKKGGDKLAVWSPEIIAAMRN